MNITLSADEAVIEGARRWAREHGTSLNDIIRQRLAELGRIAERSGAAQSFAENARSSGGRSPEGSIFVRAELYTGSRSGAVPDGTAGSTGR